MNVSVFRVIMKIYKMNLSARNVKKGVRLVRMEIFAWKLVNVKRNVMGVQERLDSVCSVNLESIGNNIPLVNV